MTAGFLTAGFLTEDFLGGDFFAAAFLGVAFLDAAFLDAAFFAEVIFAGVRVGAAAGAAFGEPPEAWGNTSAPVTFSADRAALAAVVAAVLAAVFAASFAVAAAVFAPSVATETAALAASTAWNERLPICVSSRCTCRRTAANSSSRTNPIRPTARSTSVLTKPTIISEFVRLCSTKSPAIVCRPSASTSGAFAGSAVWLARFVAVSFALAAVTSAKPEASCR